MKRSMLALVIAIAAVSAIYASTVAFATPGKGTVVTTIYGKSLFDELSIKAKTIPADDWQAQIKTKGLSDVYVVDNKFGPNSDTGWHSHPGPSLILVVSGTVTNYMGDDPTCTPHVYSAGSGFVDAGGDDVHILRNETGASAETIAVQMLPTGSVRKIDKPDPGNCHF